MKRNTTHERAVSVESPREVIDRRGFIKALGTSAVAATVGGVHLLQPKRAEAATQRPISDFLNAQGTVGDPLAPLFLGWFNLTGLFGGVDYAGVNNHFLHLHGIDLGTTFNGSVTELPLPDGHAQVTVLLHTKNAYANCIAATSGNYLLGYNFDEIAAGKRPVAVGDSLLHVVFQSAAPGAPLPDLATYPPFMTMSFQGTATGPLRTAFHVPEGTPGQMTITQTGLISVYGKVPSNSRVGFDAFPAELVNLQVVGR